MSNTPSTQSRLSADGSQHPSGGKKVLTAFGWTALIIVTVIVIYAGYFYLKLSRGDKHLVGTLLTHPTVANQFPSQSSINLMIVGRDYDYTNQDVPIKSYARADLLMIAKLDFANNEVKILSIPRDTKALIPGHLPSKINSAEQKGGPQLTEETVLTNYNIPTDKYVALDFDGFQKAIDLLGGVDLTVDKKMDYDDNWGDLHIHLTPGYQHLNGYKAMGFVRFRHSDTDIIRTKRQQALLAELKSKLDQPHTFVVLPDLINVMNSSAASDLTDGQKDALAFFLHGVPHANIQMETLPSVEGGYYVYTDWKKSGPIIQSWFGVKPPTGVALTRAPATDHSFDTSGSL